jgi:plasmid stabilization system protein ParE
VRIIWSPEAAADLDRLYDFLAPVAPEAAGKLLAALTRAPDRLREYARIGERLEGFNPREVRKIIVAKCEIHYEIMGEIVYIVRVWHSREDRPHRHVPPQ